MFLTTKVLLMDFNPTDMYFRLQQTLASLILIAASYFAPIKGITIILLILVTIDFITGCWKAIKAGGILAIRSLKLRDTVSKVIQYTMFIVSIFLIERGVLEVDWGFTKVAVSAMAIIEGISITENLYAISGNKIFDSLSTVMKDKFNDILRLKR